ncbi:hypothetical protein GJAV_G00264190 [Gymnothorax javanicus]|nr:hypothetical protein GJAV_G00264190 [Gymnothorax javanicus]
MSRGARDQMMLQWELHPEEPELDYTEKYFTWRLTWKISTFYLRYFYLGLIHEKLRITQVSVASPSS